MGDTKAWTLALMALDDERQGQESSPDLLNGIRKSFVFFQNQFNILKDGRVLVGLVGQEDEAGGTAGIIIIR